MKLAIAEECCMNEICLNCDWGIENGARDVYWCKCPKQTGSRNKNECDSCEHFKLLRNIRYYYEIKEIMDKYRSNADILKRMLKSVKRIDENYKKKVRKEENQRELYLLPLYRPYILLNEIIRGGTKMLKVKKEFLNAEVMQKYGFEQKGNEFVKFMKGLDEHGKPVLVDSDPKHPVLKVSVDLERGTLWADAEPYGTYHIEGDELNTLTNTIFQMTQDDILVLEDR